MATGAHRDRRREAYWRRVVRGHQSSAPARLRAGDAPPQRGTAPRHDFAPPFTNSWYMLKMGMVQFWVTLEGCSLASSEVVLGS